MEFHMSKLRLLIEKIKHVFKHIGIYRLIAVPILFIIFFFFSISDRSINEKHIKTSATLRETSTLYTSEHVNNYTNEDYHSTSFSTAEAGSPVMILESPDGFGIKIQLQDGRTGWIKRENLEPVTETYVRHKRPSNNRHISKTRSIGQRDIVYTVNKKTAVTRLEEIKDGSNDWTKVRTKDGTEGWIMSSYLYQYDISHYRWIDRKDWRFPLKQFTNKWSDKKIETFSNKFKEADAIDVNDSSKIYYYNNITLLDKKWKKARYGLKIEVMDNTISKIETMASIRNWSAYLPLSSILQMNFFSNHLGNYRHIFESKEVPLHEETAIKSKAIRTIVAILALIILLLILYSILEFPYHFINKYTLHKSEDIQLANAKIYMIAIVSTLVLAYPWYVFLVTNIQPYLGGFWITSLFCLGMILGNIRQWKHNLDYNRCDAEGCRQWTGSDNGTDFLGGHTTEQTITYSNGTKERNTQTVRHYIDHRLCTNCGHTWKVKRTEVFGRLK